MASKMYGDGAIISAVCHGGAIFPGVLNQLTDKSIISGRKVTGFTTKGEEEEGILDTIKSWNRPTIEKAAADSGAIYVAPPGYAAFFPFVCTKADNVFRPWDSFTQTDERIVTGANPASAEATAEAAVKAFEELTKIPRMDHDYKGGGMNYRNKDDNAHPVIKGKSGLDLIDQDGEPTRTIEPGVAGK
jgi:D-lactate dehydratase